MGKPIPLTPKTQRSGGMLDDIVARITEARAVMFDYNGNADVEVPALKISLEDEEGDDLNPQHYKAGDPAKVQPTDDGMNFEPVDEDADYEGIGKKTLAGTFLRLLDEVSKGKFNTYVEKIGDLSALEGIVARFKMVAKPKTGMGEQKYPDFPVVTEIIEAPWMKGSKGADAGSKKTSGKGKQKTIDDDVEDEEEDEDDEDAKETKKANDKRYPKAGKGKKAAEAEDEDEDEAEEETEEETEEVTDAETIEASAGKYLRQAIKAEGTMARAAAGQAVRTLAKEAEDDNWRDITTTVLNEKFLKAGAKAGRWSFDGQKVGPAKK